MKWLLVMAVVLLGVWWWRSSRRDVPRDEAKSNAKSQSKSATAAPQEMVECAHCGVHLPRTEAHQGRTGLYCSAEHLQRVER